MAHKKGKGMTGKHLSEDSKKKISIANKGRLHTQEFKLNQSKKMKGKNNPMYGKIHPSKGTTRDHKVIDIDNILLLVQQNYNTKKISEETGISVYLINKHMKHYSKELDILKHSNKHYSKGRTNYWLKGKTYEEIFKSKEKANERSAKTSAWMKTERNIRRFCTHPSKPQVELFKLIKIKYEQAVLEHPIKVNKGKTYWLDIALVKEKINIEYDGIYWHTLNGIEKDVERDKYLINNGWNVIRIKSDDKDVIHTLNQGGLKL